MTSSSTEAIRPLPRSQWVSTLPPDDIKQLQGSNARTLASIASELAYAQVGLTSWP